MVAFSIKTAWLARDKASFFSRNGVPGSNDFLKLLFSLNAAITIFLYSEYIFL